MILWFFETMLWSKLSGQKAKKPQNHIICCYMLTFKLNGTATNSSPLRDKTGVQKFLPTKSNSCCVRENRCCNYRIRSLFPKHTYKVSEKVCISMNHSPFYKSDSCYIVKQVIYYFFKHFANNLFRIFYALAENKSILNTVV